jgi:hypothetical protein
MDSVVVFLSEILPGKRQAMHFGAHIYGQLVPCLSRPFCHQEEGSCLEIRSFLTTAAMSSAGGQSSRVSSRD